MDVPIYTMKFVRPLFSAYVCSPMSAVVDQRGCGDAEGLNEGQQLGGGLRRALQFFVARMKEDL